MNTHLNLLPTQFSRRLVVRRSLLLWSVIWVVTCTSSVCVGYQKFVSLRAAQRELERQTEKCAPLKVLQQENEQLAIRIDELRKKQYLLGELEDLYDPLQMVGLVSRSATNVSSQLRIENLTFERTETTSIAGTDQDQDDSKLPTIRLILNGAATSDMAVSSFIVSLRDIGCFDVVELKSSSEAEVASRLPREFVVECVL